MSAIIAGVVEMHLQFLKENKTLTFMVLEERAWKCFQKIKSWRAKLKPSVTLKFDLVIQNPWFYVLGIQPLSCARPGLAVSIASW